METAERGQAGLADMIKHYAALAQSQVPKAMAGAERAGFATAAGAALVMACSADAAIIYSGVQNLSVQIDPTAQAGGVNFGQYSQAGFTIAGSGFRLYAGMNGGFRRFSSSSFRYSRAQYSNVAGLLVAGVANFRGPSGGSVAGHRLGAGVLIGGLAQDFAAGSAGFRRAESTSNGVLRNQSSGNFQNGTTGFVGIKLGNSDYGWIRLRLDDLGPNQPFNTYSGGSPAQDGHGWIDKATVIDWAYDNSGAPILSGAVGVVPEPSEIELLAAGLAGIAALRRRKAHHNIS